MSNSIYLSIAILFIRADLRREKRLSEKRNRRIMDNIPWNNSHLLRDIGLENEAVHGIPEDKRINRLTFDERLSFRVRSIYRLFSLRIPT